MAFRGLEAHQEVSSSRIYQDTRTTGAKFKEWLLSKEGVLFAFIAFAAIGFILPALMELCVLMAAMQFLSYKFKEFRLPVRMPIWSRLKDPSDRNPETRKPKKASGIFYLGRDRSNRRQQVFFTKDDICTHTLMLATTGSGKTEALLGMAANSMVQGSGFTFVDGKADVSLLGKVLWMAHVFGRMEDVLVVNYNTGGVDVGFDTPDQKLSNTLNPFMFGSSGALTELLVSLMSDSGGKGDFWKDRAISLVQAIIPALVWLRDKRGLLLDVSVIREYLNLPRILELRRIPEMPPNIQVSLRAYCENLAGWNERKGAQQGDTTLDQHGYLQMQFTRTLGSLADVYGHIFRTPLGEVDMYDVITNRRILLVMLPALEKSQSELQNLGRIIVALIKSMMGAALGGKIEGTIQEVLDDRFTNAETPYQTIFDEYGAYSVDGSYVMPAQARSLNIQMTFAGQDYPAFARSSEENADSIISNCNIKMFGKMEDAGKSFNIAKEAAAKATASRLSGHERKEGFIQGYASQKNASLDSIDRIDLIDLREQGVGQFHVTFGSSVIRLDALYTNPKSPKHRMDLNHLVPVRSPSEEALTRIGESMDALVSALLSGPDFLDQLDYPTRSIDLEYLFDALKDHEELPEMERAAATVAAYHRENMLNSESDDVDETVFPPDIPGMDGVNIFSSRDEEMNPTEEMLEHTRCVLEAEKGPSDKLIEATVGSEYIPDVARSMAMMSGAMDRDDVQESINKIEAAAGAGERESSQVAHQVSNELEQATHYPLSSPEPLTTDEFSDVMGALQGFVLASVEESDQASGEGAGGQLDKESEDE